MRKPEASGGGRKGSMNTGTKRAVRLLAVLALGACGGQLAGGSGDGGADGYSSSTESGSLYVPDSGSETGSDACLENPEMSECCGPTPSGDPGSEYDFGPSVCGPNGWTCPRGTPAPSCPMICMATAPDAGGADAGGNSEAGTDAQPTVYLGASNVGPVDAGNVADVGPIEECTPEFRRALRRFPSRQAGSAVGVPPIVPTACKALRLGLSAPPPYYERDSSRDNGDRPRSRSS